MKTIEVSDKKFASFVEINDYEGETWYFFIPVEGNEEAIKTLKEHLRGSEQFGFDFDEVDEYVVDILCERSINGYMPSHNKTHGKLVLPDDMEDIEEILPKGGIEGLMEWSTK
jgi:hypothetical protein